MASSWLVMMEEDLWKLLLPCRSSWQVQQSSRRSWWLQEFGSFFLDRLQQLLLGRGKEGVMGGERAWEAAPSIGDDDGEWAAAGGAAGCSRR